MFGAPTLVVDFALVLVVAVTVVMADDSTVVARIVIPKMVE
jgi:hypothetical protein